MGHHGSLDRVVGRVLNTTPKYTQPFVQSTQVVAENI